MSARSTRLSAAASAPMTVRRPRSNTASGQTRAHLFESCTVAEPDPRQSSACRRGSQQLLIRGVRATSWRLRAEADGEPCALETSTWRAAAVPGARVLERALRGLCLGPVGAHRPSRHHARLLQRHERLPRGGGRTSTLRVTIERPEGDCGRDWKLVTALPPEHGRPGGLPLRPPSAPRTTTSHRPPGRDGPLHAGTLRGRGRAARHRPHRPRRLRPRAPVRRPAPYANGRSRSSARRRRGLAAFLTMVVGGLRRAGASRLDRADLQPRQSCRGRAWRSARLLQETSSACAAHEYFTWNVKRIKPAAFTPHDLARENYTHGCCGPSRASPRITTTSPWCAAT